VPVPQAQFASKAIKLDIEKMRDFALANARAASMARTP
jgi:hypothetical protein